MYLLMGQYGMQYDLHPKNIREGPGGVVVNVLWHDSKQVQTLVTLLCSFSDVYPQERHEPPYSLLQWVK